MSPPVNQSRVFALALVILGAFAATLNGSTNGRLVPPMLEVPHFVGSWIWADQTLDKQTCRFWRAFDIPRGASVARARFWVTADNSYRVFLNGREFGKGSEHRSFTQYDLTLVLKPGRHVLAVEAFNEYSEAGLLAGLLMELEDGRVIDLASDATWQVVTEDEGGWKTRKTARSTWPAATVIAPYLGRPWSQKPVRIQLTAPVQPVVLEFWRAGWFQILLLTLSGCAAIVCLRLLGQVMLQSRAQQVLQRERARIARDIHDEMGAGLTQLVLLGEVAQSELAAESEIRSKFDRMSESGRRLLRTIDEIVWMVNSQRDTLRDFETYVCAYAEDFLRPSGIRCRLDVDAEIPQSGFDLAIRRNLFLIIKEALNNVVKHSGASEVVLRLRVTEKFVTVSVEDNGKGFAMQGGGEGHGLCNMASRAAEVGGSCRVVSQPEGRCRVELTAPITQNPERFRGWLKRHRKSISTETNAKHFYEHGA
jgi:signal transduction histidine kinase